MEAYEKIIELCREYIQGKIEIRTFQEALEKVILPDVCKKTLERIQHNAVNKLEEIRFCYELKNQRKYAQIEAENLILETNKYMHSN